MINVKELFEFSVSNENIVTAHAIYWALSQKLVNPEDDSQRLINLNFDKATIEQLAKKNVLGLGKIKLYSVECKNNWFAFYFAKDVLELANLHWTLFGQQPGKIVEANRLLYMYFTIGSENVLLIDYRKKFLSFPAYVGHAKANSYVMVKFERVVKNVV